MTHQQKTKELTAVKNMLNKLTSRKQQLKKVYNKKLKEIDKANTEAMRSMNELTGINSEISACKAFLKVNG